MVCISRRKIKNLTLGRSYVVTGINNGIHRDSNIPYSGVWVINDEGKEKHYSSRRFIGEWREKQLNELI
jgi:hypothetical protein